MALVFIALTCVVLLASCYLLCAKRIFRHSGGWKASIAATGAFALLLASWILPYTVSYIKMNYNSVDKMLESFYGEYHVDKAYLVDYYKQPMRGETSDEDIISYICNLQLKYDFYQKSRYEAYGIKVELSGYGQNGEPFAIILQYDDQGEFLVLSDNATHRLYSYKIIGYIDFDYLYSFLGETQ